MLAIAAVGVFFVTAAGWGVPLIGDSARWATVVVLLLGQAAGQLCAPGDDKGSTEQAALVVVGYLLAVIALATASLIALALLVTTVVGLVAVSTVRHARDGSRQPAPAAPASTTPRT
jgi:hypothetical protein